MVIKKKYKAIRSKFGKFLRESRRSICLSAKELAYVVGVKDESTILDWERGDRFPRDIVSYKALHLVFENIPEVMGEILRDRNITPTKTKWNLFKKTILRGPKDRIRSESAHFVSRDPRYAACKEAFGKYLRDERRKRGLSSSAVAYALGVNRVTYSTWERGRGFPSDLKALALLDRYYKNTLKVMFGLCEDKGIRLAPIEVKGILSRLSEF